VHPEIARARRALEEGRAAEARAVLDALDAGALAREDVVERALALARACLSSAPRDPGAALVALEQGLRAASTDPRLQSMKAVALLEAGRLGEADFHANRAVAYGPEQADAHFTRGVIRERRGSLEKAHRSFTRALTLEKNHLGARARRGGVARRLGRFEEARADLELYLQKVPRDAREWTALGIVRSELGQHEAALAAFKRALEIDPHDLSARFQAVVAAARERDLDLMARLVEDLARKGHVAVPGEPGVTLDRRVDWARGLLAAERGQWNEAGELLGRAFRRSLVEGELHPEPEPALVAEKLFPVLKKAHRPSEARALFEEALRKGSFSARFLKAYARAFGRPAARGLRVRLVVRSRGQGDPPERLARVYEVEAETLDEAWDLCFEIERVLNGQGLERGAVLDETRIGKEDGPILASILALYPRGPEEEPQEQEQPEQQGFEPEKGWSPDEEGQGDSEGSGGDEGG
jgi:tetratricopeptide (TPR) repeat protein